MDTSDGTDDDWLSVLSSINASTIPKGYKTVDQLAEEYGYNKRKIRYLLNNKAEQGTVEVLKVSIGGRTHNAYKLKNPS